MIKLYKNIRKIRLEKRLSQDTLAKLIGYTDRSMIAKIEKGEVDLSESKITVFAKALGTTAPALMGWGDEINNDPTTITVHLGTNDLTADELDDVANYIELVKKRRNK